MSAESGLAFVDTNILVYALDETDSSKKQIAQRLIEALMDRDRLRVSTQVLQELYVVLTRKLRHGCSSEEAVAVLDDLAVWPLMVVDFPAIRAAVQVAEESTLSFWDALIVISAARSGAAVLYTEDLTDGQKIFGVRICNPFAA